MKPARVLIRRIKAVAADGGLSYCLLGTQIKCFKSLFRFLWLHAFIDPLGFSSPAVTLTF